MLTLSIGSLAYAPGMPLARQPRAAVRMVDATAEG
jgi:hypothetical protein